jgi:DnaJ-class molecular chaperone
MASLRVGGSETLDRGERWSATDREAFGMAGERSTSDRTKTRAKLNSGDQAKPGTPGTGENTCPDCGGSGRLGAQPCRTCGGTGRIIEGISGG